MSESIDHRDGICAAEGGGGKDMTGSCAVSEGGDIMIEIWGGVLAYQHGGRCRRWAIE